MGHLFFIKLFHYEIINIELLPFGGYTKTYQKINSNINNDILVACGGFIFQLILFIILFTFKRYLNIITYELYIQYNFIILIFNLIPIVPLDGSHIVHLIMEKFLPYKLSYYLNAFLSICCLSIFIFINYFWQFDNYFIISFLIYKIVIYLKDYKYLHKRFLLERYLYNLDYRIIDNHTKTLNELRKNTLHFFKNNNRYINEKKMIEKELYQSKKN